MGASPSKLTAAPQPPQEVLEEKMRGSMNSLSISATDVAPLSSSGGLSTTLIENWESKAASDPRTKLARTVLATTNIHSSLLDRTAQIADQHVFNHVIDFKTGPRTDQKSSGRCWLFATTNVLRYEAMKKLNISELELSQASRGSPRARTGHPVLVLPVTDSCSRAALLVFLG
jgi:bleomycin hydrolase